MLPIGLITAFTNGLWTPPSRIARNLFATTLVIGAVISCGRMDSNEHGKSIAIDREVLLSEFKGGAQHIAKLDDGTLIVTGTGRTAWVIATNANGELLWKYVDPFNEMNSERAISQSVFHGIAPLSNGNILFCGEINAGLKTNLIVILSRDGHLVERRSEVPEIDKSLSWSTFYRIEHVTNGMLLLSPVLRDGNGFHWIVRLDNAGKTIGQSFFNFTDQISASSPRFDFTIDLVGADNRDWKLYGVSLQGNIAAARQLKLNSVSSSFTTQLRSVRAPASAQFVTFPVGANPILYTFSDRLEDAVPPLEIFNIDTTQGVGYALPDRSIAMFGRTSTAAIAWLDPAGKAEAIRVFNSGYQSYTIKDAVALSATQFVAIRDGVANNPVDAGVLMDWVTLNQKP